MYIYYVAEQDSSGVPLAIVIVVVMSSLLCV